MKRKIIDNFIFCPRCQKKLIKKNDFYISCSFCNFFIYFNPTPTNALIIENQQKEILFVKRKYPPKKDWFDLPGGFVNLDETIEESVKREIKEELNLTIDNFFYLGSYSDEYLYRQIVYKTLCFVFYKKINQITHLQPNDDVKKILFFKKEKIPWSRIAFKGIRQALKDYFKL